MPAKMLPKTLLHVYSLVVHFKNYFKNNYLEQVQGVSTYEIKPTKLRPPTCNIPFWPERHSILKRVKI